MALLLRPMPKVGCTGIADVVVEAQVLEPAHSRRLEPAAVGLVRQARFNSPAVEPGDDAIQGDAQAVDLDARLPASFAVVSGRVVNLEYELSHRVAVLLRNR